MRSAPVKLLAPISVLALALSACGGGSGGGASGNVRPDGPPPPPPSNTPPPGTVPPPPPGNTPPPPPGSGIGATCTDPSASNTGGTLPCLYRYTGQADNLLVPANIDAVQSAGFSGAGVHIGMYGAVSPSGYAPLNGKQIMSRGPATGNTGNALAAILVGDASGTFKGGLAPGASLSASGFEFSAADLNQTLAEGARLIHLGYGNGYNPNTLWSDSNAWGAQLGGLITSNALLIQGTGDAGQFEPDNLLHLPRYDARYVGHLIAATAVDLDANGNIISSVSANRCGAAARWCLAAPGTVRVPSIDGTPNPALDDNTAMLAQGSEVAAAIITGTAAMVLEAYPWMSASNVQQTLLTTATDLGQRGVDSTYGWGLVNAAKAINGPSQFLKTQSSERFIADIQSGESRPFYNDISGDGGLWKRGSGSLTLAGNNTYRGDTFVDEGTLRVTGTLRSDVEVAPGATFATAGNGVWIDGDYEAYSEREWNREHRNQPRTGMATTAIQLGAPLHVTEDAEIDGSRLLLLPPADGYTVNATETLITTGEGIDGRFAEVNTSQGFFWAVQLNYTRFNLTANLTRTSAQAQAMALGAPEKVINGAAMADALIGYTDNLVESGQSAGHESLLDATARLMSAANNETAALSLSSLTGDVHGAARHLGIQRALGDGERLSERLRSLGTRAEHGVWVQHDSGHGHLARIGYGDAEVRHSVFGIGMDERFSETWTLGFSTTRTRSNAHLDTLGGRLTGSGSQMAVYARTDLGRKGYLSGLASHDRHLIDTQRRVLAGNTLASVIGQHTDSTTLVRLESGLRLGSGLTPYLAAGSLSLRQGGFTESGLLGLSAAADTFSTTFADLGARFDRRFGQWSFASTLSARRLFGGDTGFNAAFTGAEAARFSVNGQPLARTQVRFGNELNYRTRYGWQYALSLGAEQGGGSQRGNAWGEARVEVGF